MHPFLEPYNYYFLREQTQLLAQTHRSVNDRSTIQAVRGLAFETIKEELSHLTQEELAIVMAIEKITDSQREVDRYLENLRLFVRPFKQPSEAGIKKAFAKTKKIQMPDWETIDLKEYSFYAWNDPGQQSKFILYYQNAKLQGLQGTISNEVKKGICTICHGTSGVSLFTVKGKVNKDGQYKTKGNYICYNSEACNRQLQTRTHFDAFIEQVKAK
ncbi:FusB/FusC family EF-G-binding protein [Enterococcus sp.]|uniref:FusB/FusC family EF-G-binding protein n=1 Tax=Enterococcus sp. TaxID=35783 RepID=UPI002FC72EFC